MKIDFNYEGNFKLEDEDKFADWIDRVLRSEQANGDAITYIFCDDEFLAEINLQYLNHDTYTDIITFDYSDDTSISGDIFISTERIVENALKFKVSFDNELKRVMVHGLLHLMGYNDKKEEERLMMRKKEEEKIKMFHVEQ